MVPELDRLGQHGGVGAEARGAAYRQGPAAVHLAASQAGCSDSACLHITIRVSTQSRLMHPDLTEFGASLPSQIRTLTSKDGGDAEVGCHVVQNQAALDIPTDCQLAAALQEGSSGDCTGMSILNGLHTFPACPLELPQIDFTTCMSHQQDVALHAMHRVCSFQGQQHAHAAQQSLKTQGHSG